MKIEKLCARCGKSFIFNEARRHEVVDYCPKCEKVIVEELRLEQEEREKEKGFKEEHLRTRGKLKIKGSGL